MAPPQTWHESDPQKSTDHLRYNKDDNEDAAKFHSEDGSIGAF